MSIVERNLKKVNEFTYVRAEQNLFLLIIGLASLVFFSFLFIPMICESLSLFDFIFALFAYLVVITMFLFFTLLGILKTWIKIDTKEKTVSMILRNAFFKKSDVTVPFKFIQVSSVRIGVTDANPHDTYIVKAGAYYEYNGTEIDIAAISDETTSQVKSHEMMKELYFFFFPERKDDNIHFVTDGTATYIVNDTEKFELELMMKEKNENTKTSNDANDKSDVSPEKKKPPGKGLDLEW